MKKRDSENLYGDPNLEAKNARYNKSRRRLLQSLAAGGAVVSVKELPGKWARPVLDVTMLPAHAQATCQPECEISEITGSDVVRISTTNPIEIDRWGIPGLFPLCGNLASFESFVDDITLGFAATVDPSCGPATLTATMDGATNLFAIIPSTITQVGPVNQNTGAVSFSPFLVGFDPTGYTVNSNGTVESAELDVRIQAGGASCVIDVTFSERFNCSDNCLAHGSQIVMADGRHRRVEDLQVGDMVRSMATPQSGFDYAVVTKVKTHHLREAYYVINDELRITGDHPVLVQRKDGWSWVRVDALAVGEVIKSIDGGLKVDRFHKRNKPVMTVYVETSSGNFVARAGDKSYVVKSTYATEQEKTRVTHKALFAV